MLLNALVSFVVALAVVTMKDRFYGDENGTLVAVMNYDVVTTQASLDTPEKTEKAFARLNASATKLAAAGYVVVDSRALAAYPPDLEVPSPVEQDQMVESAHDE